MVMITLLTLTISGDCDLFLSTYNIMYMNAHLIPGSFGYLENRNFGLPVHAGGIKHSKQVM